MKINSLERAYYFSPILAINDDFIWVKKNNLVMKNAKFVIGDINRQI